MTLNNSMSITPSPPGQAKGVRFEHGSLLGGKIRAARVSSQWKSTSWVHLDGTENRIRQLRAGLTKSPVTDGKVLIIGKSTSPLVNRNSQVKSSVR
jgi:hypothetical protein